MKRLPAMLVLGLVLLAAPAQAERTAVVQPVEELDIQVWGGEAMARGVCVYGNRKDPAWVITDWIWGAEGYKYLFYPPIYQCCQVGFHVDTVHMLLQFGPEDVPATFDVYVDLEDALWDDTVGCWVPGVVDCVSPVFTVTIVEAGLWDVGIPLGDWCECAYLDYDYFLSFHFESAFPEAARPDAVADGYPLGCTSYLNYGAGWEDLVHSYGWPGEVKIWADVTCCDQPVDVESSSWGRIKGMFR